MPCSVLDDLVRAGEVASPYHERDSRQAEWVPERHWIYRTRVAGPGILRFHGIDFGARVYLDGEAAAEHDSMYRPLDV